MIIIIIRYTKKSTTFLKKINKPQKNTGVDITGAELWQRKEDIIPIMEPCQFFMRLRFVKRAWYLETVENRHYKIRAKRSQNSSGKYVRRIVDKKVYA